MALALRNVRRAAVESLVSAAKPAAPRLLSKTEMTPLVTQEIETATRPVASPAFEWIPFPLRFSKPDVAALLDALPKAPVMLSENVEKAARKFGLSVSEYQYLRLVSAESIKNNLVVVLRLLGAWNFQSDTVCRTRLLKAAESLAIRFDDNHSLLHDTILLTFKEVLHSRHQLTYRSEETSKVKLDRRTNQGKDVSLQMTDVTDHNEQGTPLSADDLEATIPLTVYEANAYMMTMIKLQAVHPELFHSAVSAVAASTSRALTRCDLLDLAKPNDHKITLHNIASAMVCCVKLRYRPTSFYEVVLDGLRKSISGLKEGRATNLQYVLSHAFSSLTLLAWAFTIMGSSILEEVCFTQLVQTMLQHHKETLVQGSQHAKLLLSNNFKFGKQLKEYREVVSRPAVAETITQRQQLIRSPSLGGTLNPAFAQLRQITFALMAHTPAFRESVDPDIVAALTQMAKTHMYDVTSSEIQRCVGRVLRDDLQLPVIEEESILADPGIVVDYALVPFTQASRRAFAKRLIGAASCDGTENLDDLLSNLTLPFKKGVYRVAIEADGTYHYVTNLEYFKTTAAEKSSSFFPAGSTFLNGTSEWKERQLSRYGWKVVRFPCFKLRQWITHQKEIDRVRAQIPIHWDIWKRTIGVLLHLRKQCDERKSNGSERDVRTTRSASSPKKNRSSLRTPVVE